MRRKVPIRVRMPERTELSNTTDPSTHAVKSAILVGQTPMSDQDGEALDPDFSWAAPEPSRASRNFALRSTASYRGSLVDHGRNRQFNFESLLELDHLYIALTHNEVADVEEQPSPITYVGPDGQPAIHTFDALVTLKNGRRIAVDVKPRSKVERSGIRTVQRLIRDQIGTGFADAFVVRTEDHLHPDDVWDARWTMRARRLADPRADAAVQALLPCLHTWCRLRDFVAAVGIEAAGFNAAVRLIALGLLEVRDRVRITHDCFVRRARV